MQILSTIGWTFFPCASPSNSVAWGFRRLHSPKNVSKHACGMSVYVGRGNCFPWRPKKKYLPQRFKTTSDGPQKWSRSGKPKSKSKSSEKRIRDRDRSRSWKPKSKSKSKSTKKKKSKSKSKSGIEIEVEVEVEFCFRSRDRGPLRSHFAKSKSTSKSLLRTSVITCSVMMTSHIIQ